MAAVKTLIERVELASSAASITFSDIPQTFTHLELVVSARSTSSIGSNAVPIDAIINGSSSDMTVRYLEGTGSGVASATDLGRIMAIANSSTNTASTFSNSACYIPNYAVTTTAKSWSIDSVIENNATFGLQTISANLWNPSTKAAISSLTLDMRTGDFAQYSSATLYGWTRGSDGVTTVS